MHTGWSSIRILAQIEVEERVAWAARHNTNNLDHPRKRWIDVLSASLRKKHAPEPENSSFVGETSVSQGA